MFLIVNAEDLTSVNSKEFNKSNVLSVGIRDNDTVVYGYKTDTVVDNRIYTQQEINVSYETIDSKTGKPITSTKIINETIKNELIDKREPDKLFFDDNSVLIFPKPQFYKENDKWTYIEYSNMTLDKFSSYYSEEEPEDNWFISFIDFIFSPIIEFVSGAIYSNMTYTSASDGYVQTYCGGASATWTCARDALSGTAVSNGASYGVGSEYKSATPYYTVNRAFFYFNLTGIESNTIINVTLMIWDLNYGCVGCSAQIFNATPQTPLNNADFDAFTIAITNNMTVVKNKYNGFKYTSAGITQVENVLGKGWHTPMFAEYKHDVLDVDCNDTGTNSDVQYEMPLAFSESTGTANDPYLLIYFDDTPPPEPSGICNWSSGNINCSNYCNLTSNLIVSSLTERFYGTGYINVNANLTIDSYILQKGCEIRQIDSNRIIIKK